MQRIIKASSNERQQIFQTAATQMHISPEMVEKDFWVCRTLQNVFQDEKLRKILRFKGGTSLSKVFHLIQRFSEDIDLILDWRCVTDENPLLSRSNTKQDSFNKSIQENSGKYISENLRTMISAVIDPECSIKTDERDNHVLLLEYPKTFSASYIVPHIRLEVGPLAAWMPNQEFVITSYVGEQFPQLGLPAIAVPTILAERTFWEKVTILHQEHFRPEQLNVPSRYSRHYYDLFMMSKSTVMESSARNIQLLEQVVEFKKKFYPRGWARYDLAVPGSIELLPPDHSLNFLQSDYLAMKSMIYGDYPQWDDILKSLASLQKELNSISTASDGISAMRTLSAISQANGNSEMTLDEINAEIAAARKSK